MNENIIYFACGYCENNLKMIFHGVKSKKIKFLAGVYFIRHPKMGNILYDTGYSSKIDLKNKDARRYKNFTDIKRILKYKIYNLCNPVSIKKKEEIDSQLKKKGILPSQIQYIILSHLHPDHIGRIRAFPNAKIIISRDLYQNLMHIKWKHFVFWELLPENFWERLMIIEPDRYDISFPYIKTYDLAGDGSLLLSSLDGHTKGQTCVYIKERNIFIASDVCWGVDLLPYTKKMRKLPLWIQDDKEAYFDSIALLKKIQNNGVKVLVSHDGIKRVKRVLYE